MHIDTQITYKRSYRVKKIDQLGVINFSGATLTHLSSHLSFLSLFKTGSTTKAVNSPSMALKS